MAAWGCYISSAYKLYAIHYDDKLYDDKYLTLIGSISSAFNGFRIIWGALFDKINFKLLMLINIAI